MKKLRKNLIKTLVFLIDTTRPFLGPTGCCIYRTSCTQYAKETLYKKSFFMAIPLIVLRLLSCNPITALFFKLIHQFYRP